MIIPTIETECPNCECPVTLTDFDPEDKDQYVKCEECEADFEDWTLKEDGTLVLDIASMVIYDDDDDEEDEDDEDDEEDAADSFDPTQEEEGTEDEEDPGK